MDSPTRTASARAMCRPRSRSSFRPVRIMKKSADARLARMARKASTTTYFMQPIIRKRTDDARGFRADWRFWCITVAALATMAATAALGRWQLDRAAQKEAWQATVDARQAQPPLDGAAWAALPAVAPQQGGAGAEQGAQPQVHGPAEALVHRAVVLRGRWLPRYTVFLDNRQMQGRPGFFVLTPMQLEPPAAQGTVVLVQRGWVPRDFQDRTRLPEVPAPAGTVEVRGRIAAPPSRLYEPGGGSAGTSGTSAGEGSSRIRQNLDMVAYRAETGLAGLAPLTVLETGGPEGGLLRDWPVVDAGVAKHHGYAFQWFGLCALVAILYVWFQLVRCFFRPGRQPAPPA